MSRTVRQLPPVSRVGIVSLGCPKALVDSERILTRLRAEGYAISGSYDDADVVLVDSRGFLDSAKAESPKAVDEAIAENGWVMSRAAWGRGAASRMSIPTFWW